MLKFIFYGAPQYHTLANASLNAASYGNPAQFADDSSHVDGGEGQKNSYGQFAYGFGRAFNGNVHVSQEDLSNTEIKRNTSLLDALLFRSKIGVPPNEQVGGWIIANGRASLNNNISHRPQLEIHYSWQINNISKITSTAFLTKGMDYSDDVYPAWFIPRDSTGHYDYNLLVSRNYWGGDQVFEYRYYSDFFQTGVLSAFTTHFHKHELSLGLETRYWSSRHAGEVLNNFGKDEIGVPMGNIIHLLKEGDLFYDFTTTKPQFTLFGHSLWNWGKVHLMTNVQYSSMRFHVHERVPSNNNYPNFIDSTAISTHSGSNWIGNATWDNDNDPQTPEVSVEYTLWNYYQNFEYITPRFGVSYAFLPELNIYTNWSIGVKEPEIKHFFGYGAPRNDIELEKTDDIEIGINYRQDSGNYQFLLQLTYYKILFAGKMMQITIPEKANTPGYDYAGHYYVPIGNATYEGVELSTQFSLPYGISIQTSASRAYNTWGEPNGSEGAQKLYANEAVAGIDYNDLNENDVWDEGGSESALHRNFVGKYGARHDVGMPQMMMNSTLGFTIGSFLAHLSVRYFRDIYVLENNDEIRISDGKDDLFGTADDQFSATLPSAFITDFSLNLSHQLFSQKMNLFLQVSNLFDTAYWQRGNEYGVIPGAVRTFSLSVKLFL